MERMTFVLFDYCEDLRDGKFSISNSYTISIFLGERLRLFGEKINFVVSRWMV